jgi:hypothetical protein
MPDQNRQVAANRLFILSSPIALAPPTAAELYGQLAPASMHCLKDSKTLVCAAETASAGHQRLLKCQH